MNEFDADQHGTPGNGVMLRNAGKPLYTFQTVIQRLPLYAEPFAGHGFTAHAIHQYAQCVNQHIVRVNEGPAT